MTELSFLLDLLLNHKLPKATQLAVKDRIGLLESNHNLPWNFTNRAGATNTIPSSPTTSTPSPAAAQALAQRQQLMESAGTVQPGTKSPRKF
jgi:hypothetical protein